MEVENKNAVTFIVNSKELKASNGLTIMEALLANGIDIPHLCYDPRLPEPNRSCGLCIVKLVKENKIVRSCDAPLLEGMEIITTSTELDSFRKVRMEQLLSDHNADCDPPCKQTCPAEIDIQGYLRQVAQGNFAAALRIIKEKNPFPMTCGRVCPHPCEEKCRRNLTDDAVAINYVKRFVADLDASSEAFMPRVAENSGKKIAVIGAGPSGLSAAYYSRIFGHSVTVFERQPKAGGMMRYGIPDYRLPQETLDQEIAIMAKMGIVIKTGVSLGANITLDNLQDDFDAVYMAVGSWQASSMRVEGEQLPGVWKGIEYLEQIVKGKNLDLGKNVVVVGGGNTAIDCARTALRKGAEKVTILYRRTKDEMPAESYEIEEAIHEGVEMKFLAAPVGFESDDKGIVNGIKCVKMQLGEADRSGRRRPIMVEGSEYTLPVSAVIGAIGQKTNTSYLWDDLPLILNRWGDVEINGRTMETSAAKVFAGGDCVTGPATVVQAVGAGRKAAEAMDQFVVSGYVSEFKEDYSCSRGSFEDLPRYEFENRPKLERATQNAIDVEKAKASFDEVEFAITAKQAIDEAERCLECGCNKRNVCQLRDEASDLGVVHDSQLQIKRNYPMADDHQFILRDTNKCISCGRCVSACNDIEGPSVLGLYIKKGKLCVGTRSGQPLNESGCVSCGHCVTACPCGALDYKRESDSVFKALNNEKKTVVGFVAPAVRSLICDHYNLSYDEASPFMAGMLKALGFDRIFDFSFAADLTIMEETTEFLGRIEKEKLPLFTSCCPGWVNFVETRYPKILPYLSSCKSPQQMMGATVTHHLPIWLAENTENAPEKENVFVVSIVPCLAKKAEAAREEFDRDVDAVLTSSELIEMIDQMRISQDAIIPCAFDDPYKKVSGAGILFGASGGVAEAALRMAVSKVGEGEVKQMLDFVTVRGLEGVKTATLDLLGRQVKVAVVSGLAHVEPIIEQVLNEGISEYDLIEVMACPGGCISGAGHPAPKTKMVLKERQNVLIALDETSKVRRSEENPDVLALYEDFYGEANSERSHKYLHTEYFDRTNGLIDAIKNKADSAWKVRKIQVCMDSKCASKGSYQLLEDIENVARDQGVERFFDIKGGLFTGHSFPEQIFVAVDGKRVDSESMNDLDAWIMGLV
jgi:formate dehydrogenase major subunit